MTSSSNIIIKLLHSFYINPNRNVQRHPQISCSLLNTLRPRQNGRHFADDVFKCIILNGNLWISIKISLKFVPKGPINNIPALVQIMTWRRPGDKPLSEPMMVRLPTHICVTRPQWVNRNVLGHFKTLHYCLIGMCYVILKYPTFCLIQICHVILKSSNQIRMRLDISKFSIHCFDVHIFSLVYILNIIHDNLATGFNHTIKRVLCDYCEKKCVCVCVLCVCVCCVCVCFTFYHFSQVERIYMCFKQGRHVTIEQMAF